MSRKHLVLYLKHMYFVSESYKLLWRVTKLRMMSFFLTAQENVKIQICYHDGRNLGSKEYTETELTKSNSGSSSSPAWLLCPRIYAKFKGA